MEKLAIVVVTYKRQQLLTKLFDSILASTQAPWRVVVVDNENSSQTRSMVKDFTDALTSKWGKTSKDTSGNELRALYVPMTENSGGSGGFSKGVETAYNLGAQWFWIMDDDVAIEPEGMERLSKWAKGHEVIQGQRYDYDGGPFYWQYHFIVPLGIPDPSLPRASALQATGS